MTESDMRILLVDDEEDVRTQIVNALLGNGYQIDEFGDVESAAIAIGKGRSAGWEFDAAILDLRLPSSPSDVGTAVDDSLCQLVRYRTLVWHISAYFDEEEVKRHVKKYHSADE